MEGEGGIELSVISKYSENYIHEFALNSVSIQHSKQRIRIKITKKSLDEYLLSPPPPLSKKRGYIRRMNFIFI